MNLAADQTVAGPDPLPIIEELRTIFESVFGERLSGFDRNMSPESFEKWDSTNHANLILEIERRFSIEFSPDEFVSLVSVGEMESAIRGKGIEDPLAELPFRRAN